MSSPWDLTAAAVRQPWRLWTGPLAHWGLGHAALNLLACAVPWSLLAPGQRRRLAWGLPALLPLLSLMLLPALGGGTYRGASGLACLLWAAAGWGRWASGDWRLGWTVLGLLGLKLALEGLFGLGALARDEGWAALPAAHLQGAGVGTLVGGVWMLRRKPGPGQTAS